LIVHLVLYTPRPDLTDAERATIRETLEHALTRIPAIRSYRVGRRVRMGAIYDRVAPLNFEYLVAIDVDDEHALSEYLAHPAHQTLGQLFYKTSAHALACDFKVGEISDLQ
jgi:Stress responsive A/B Barrel Domain